MSIRYNSLMRTSYSALETYIQCPRKYAYQEIEKIKAPKSKEALFGTAVHGALQYMFSKDPLFPTLEEILAQFRESFDAKKIIIEDERKRFLGLGEKIITQFYKKNPPWNFGVIDLEARFETVLTDPLDQKTHVLVGKIDRIDKHEDGTYEVIDYKTSRKLPAQSDVDKNMQLAVYQLGLKNRWPELNPSDIQLSLYYLRANEKLSTSRSEEDLKKTEEEILSLIHSIEESIEKDNFPPVPSVLCDWCGYKPICPAWKHLYKKENIDDPKEKVDIDTVMHEYATLKKDIDEKERKLKELISIVNDYFDAHNLDRVFGQDGTLSRSYIQRTSWDSEKIKTILAHSPLLPRLLDIDTKKIKMILPELPYELREQIKREAQMIKQYSSLKLSNKKEKPT